MYSQYGHSIESHGQLQRARNSSGESTDSAAAFEGEPQEMLRRHAKPLYSDEYRQLLNDTIADAAAQIVYRDSGPLPSNYIGASLWTADEKERFFNALARHGKDNIRAISASINTKTEVEVRAYLLLLRQGALEKHRIEPRQQMLGYADLPAALELSQECCDALGQAAEALDSHQQNFEANSEKEKWQGLWLLTQDVGTWAEERMSESDQRLEEVAEVLPEVELLRLRTWLELSERIFMNPAAPREDENWRSFTSEIGETPSIRYTAFVDFHTLAVSITRRLVQATLFFAMSRLRSTDSKVFGRQPLVKPRDVHAATKVLGMKSNSRESWRGAARRCGLHVYRNILQSVVKNGTIEPLSYEEVEAALCNGRKPEQTKVGSKPDSKSVSGVGDTIVDLALEFSSLPEADSSESSVGDEGEAEGEGSIHGPMGSLEASGIATSSPSESDATTIYSSTRKKRKATLEIERAEDLYADALDQRASLEEERRLWTALNRQPQFELDPKGIELPMQPKRLRKRREELADWRDNVNYTPEWETMKPIVQREEEIREPGGEDGDVSDVESEGDDSSSGDS
ncbi:hypothetical protein GP486_005261 [Trichoglossum hirsutum]|uniref:Myb-like domain-containing protein n=1 Tax=Trichoglossum hirsutum TaxID=265104 RepID=A0A9P8RN38_9PEZI|nr:hypothetical protein GP486_005261 [Trichoglossum hirsutum]